VEENEDEDVDERWWRRRWWALGRNPNPHVEGEQEEDDSEEEGQQQMDPDQCVSNFYNLMDEEEEKEDEQQDVVEEKEAFSLSSSSSSEKEEEEMEEDLTEKEADEEDEEDEEDEDDPLPVVPVVPLGAKDVLLSAWENKPFDMTEIRQNFMKQCRQEMLASDMKELDSLTENNQQRGDPAPPTTGRSSSMWCLFLPPNPFCSFCSSVPVDSRLVHLRKSRILPLYHSLPH